MSVADEIRKPGELREDGLLTDVEFENQKAQLLGGPDSSGTVAGPGRASTLFRLLIGATALFGIFYAFGWWQPSAAALEKQRARDVIKHCWAEAERKALTPNEKRFTARACELLVADFEKEYGNKP